MYAQLIKDVCPENKHFNELLDNVQFPIPPTDIIPIHERLLTSANNTEVESVMIANISMKQPQIPDSCNTQFNSPIDIQLEISPLVRVPISIQQEGHEPILFQGILDTAAQLPVLSGKFCRKHIITITPITKANIHPTYFDSKTSLPSLQTVPLLVRYDGVKPVLCVFLVLESDSVECLIGGRLRDQLGLHDDRDITQHFPTNNDPPPSAEAFAIFNLTVVPTSAPSHNFPDDDDMISQDWEELPSHHVFDIPIAFTGVGPTRQHVINHQLDAKDQALVEPYLPAILAKLNENNEVTKPINGVGCFINHPDAIVYLRHEEGTKPKFLPQPKLTGRKADAIRAQIKLWLAKGKIRLIRPGENEWNSQMLTAPKPGSFHEDGSQKLRICFNGKPSVNIGLICDNRRTPPILEILSRCHGVNWFTELDCEDAYLQLILDAESQKVTAFEFDDVRYCFVGAPYGITFIGNTFHNCIKNIFRDLPFVVNYIDNIWIITPDDDLDLHVRQVMLVIARCNQYNIRLNLRKPVLCKRRFIGLGHFISTEGISLDPHKVQAVSEWQPQAIQTVRAMRAFLGSTNFLRENIYRHADITVPLYAEQKPKNGKQTLSETSKIVWTPALLKAFKILQQAISTAPMLNYTDTSKPIALATDASRAAVSVTMFHPSKPGELPNESNIVSFYSRSLHNSEIGYAAYKLEFLAVITALRRYHDFLFGVHFSLYTDHQALTDIWTKPEFNNTYAGWIIEVYDYSFDIYHIPGDTNILPDTLSRLYNGHKWGIRVHTSNKLPTKEQPLPVRSLILTNPDQPIIGSVLTYATAHDTSVLQDLPSIGDTNPTFQNPLFKPFIATLTMNASSSTSTDSITAVETSTNTTLQNTSSSGLNPLPNTLAETSVLSTDHATKEVVTTTVPQPTAHQLFIISTIHDSLGHFGVSATYNRLRRLHSWPNMIHHVRQFVASCQHCQRWTIVKRGYNPIRSALAWLGGHSTSYNTT